MKFLAVICLLIFTGATDSAKILGVFHFNGKSHFIMFEALMKGLAAKGHDVTVVSHFPQDKPLPNYRDLSLKGSVADFVNNISIPMILEKWIGRLDMFMFIWQTAGVELCDAMFQHPVIQDLLKSEEKYDLLVTEAWGCDCFPALAHKFQVPHMSMISTMEVPWLLPRYGNPYNPAFQTNHFTTFSTKGMTFWERVYNTLLTLFIYVGHHFVSMIPTDQVTKKYLGNDIPSIFDTVNNSSLLLINAHFSMIGSRPLAPNIVEVGGLHIPEAKPLPPEIQKYLDDAKEGVIVFSLGSLIQSETFDQDKLQAFLKVFKNLPLKVLWKFGGKMENQPKNIKIMKWLPQSDVLRHPNVKIFITHGGLMGTQEAVLAGVPMIGIPFFADQRFNIQNYVEKGFALDLHLEDINEGNVRSRINEILNNPSFGENAKKYSLLFRDRPQSALETSIWWTEYVLRHKGAPHLFSAARELSWYQYHLLDVLGFIIVSFVLILFVLCNIVKVLFNFLLCRKKGNQEHKKLKKN